MNSQIVFFQVMIWKECGGPAKSFGLEVQNIRPDLQVAETGPDRLLERFRCYSIGIGKHDGLVPLVIGTVSVEISNFEVVGHGFLGCIPEFSDDSSHSSASTAMLWNL